MTRINKIVDCITGEITEESIEDFVVSGREAEQKREAVASINDTVNTLTRLFVTVLDKQSATYAAKEQEAKTFDPKKATPEAYPYLFAEVAGMKKAKMKKTYKGFDLTVEGLVQEYLFNSALWHGLDAAIEAIRPVGVQLIREGESIGYIEQVRDVAVSSIQALASCTSAEDIQAVLVGVDWPAKK